VITGLTAIAILLLCYVVGGIPSGLLIARAAGGIDIREHGSRNIGATNVWRVLGWKWGLATWLLDTGKACGIVLLVAPLSGGVPAWLPIAGGLATLMGNFFNPFLKFKGGKGVATSLGVFLALAPAAVIIAFAAFVVVVAITRYISVGSIVAATVLPLLVLYFNGGGLLFVAILLVSCLVIFKHRANIQRLRAGTEAKIGAAR